MSCDFVQYANLGVRQLAPLRLRRPFKTNSLAQAAGCAALLDQAVLKLGLDLVQHERSRLAKYLSGLDLTVLSCQGNFLCVDFHQDTHAIYTKLLKSGIIVRPLAGYNLPSFLRISLGTADDHDRLLSALQSG